MIIIGAMARAISLSHALKAFLTGMALGVAFILGMLAGSARAEARFRCEVTHVSDGDTWRCAGMVSRIRGWGWDSADMNCRYRTHCRERIAKARA